MEVAQGLRKIIPPEGLDPAPKSKVAFWGQEAFCCVAQGPHVGPYGGIPKGSPGDRYL